MPPGANYPKVESTALAHPEETAIGRKVEPRAKAHPGLSGIPALRERQRRVHAARADGGQRAAHARRPVLHLQGRRHRPAADERDAARGATAACACALLIDDTEARGQDDRVGAARRASEHRGAPLQPVLLPRLDRAAALRRVRADDEPAQLPDAQQALRRRQRDRRSSAAATSATSTSIPATTCNSATTTCSRWVRSRATCRRASTSTGTARSSIPVRALFGTLPTGPKLEADGSSELAAHLGSECTTATSERAIRTGNPLAGLLNGDTGVVWAKARSARRQSRQGERRRRR